MGPGEGITPETGTDADADEAHRSWAVEANNATWELIDLAERSPDQVEDMLRRAYAAAYHWDRAARSGPQNAARADWLLAKVQLLAGRPDVSLLHAYRVLDTCERHGLVDFDLAYAHEATARALHALGRREEAAQAWAAARSVPIAEDDDREILAQDLAEGP